MTVSREMLLVVLLLLVGVTGCGKKASDSEPEAMPEIVIAVYDGGKQGAISGPLYHWQEKWQTDNKAKLTIVPIPYAQLYEKIMADVRNGGGEFDGVMAPAFMYGDFIEHDYILPIDEFFNKPGFPQWEKESVVPPIAKLHQWDDVWYGCPNDADAHILYYREDILANEKYKQLYQEKTGKALRLPPRTWEDVAEIAETFEGVDWNENGADDEDGIALHLKVGGQGYWHYMSLSAPYVVNRGPEVTRYQNVYAFDPETMEPIIDSPGHVRALEMLRRLAKTGNKAQTSWGLDEAWNHFLQGNALFCFSWGDLGRLAQDAARSKVKGKLGCATLPGTMFVWSRKNNDWTELSHPNLVANTCGASWHGVICKNGRHHDLVYHLFAYHANRLVNMFNIGQGWSGIDPGRDYQFLTTQGGQARIEDYTQYGFDENDVTEYTGAYRENYFATTATLEYLRIPGATRFFTALDDELSRGMSDTSIPAEQIMKAVADKWRQIVSDMDRELGPGRLKTLYQQSIGYKPEEKK